MTKDDFPGAPLESYVCPEGWLVVGDQAWTVEEWRSTDSIYRNGRGGRPGRPLRTHCMRGHEFTPDNTYYTARSGRQCRICKAATARIRYEQRVSAA